MPSSTHLSEREELGYLRSRVAELERQNLDHSRVARALEESRDLFQAFMSQIPAFAWMKDEPGRYVYANAQTCDFFSEQGLSCFDCTDFDLWPQEVAASIRERDQEALASEKPEQTIETAPSKRGDRQWRVVRFPFRTQSAKSYVGGIAVDVTERLRLEHELRERTRAEESVRAEAMATLQALRRSETRSYRVFQSGLIGIVECEGNVIVDANATLLGWLGYSPGDVAGAKLNWSALTTDEYRQADEQALIQLRAEGTFPPYERELIHLDGHRIPVLMGGSALDRERASFVAFILNITERKRMEERLLQSQKLESLGLIAGGVAHDFNNLLATIMGNASLSLDAVSPEHPGFKPLGEVVIASRRASVLTQQVLAYSGRANFCVHLVNLSSAVQEIGSLLETTISKKIELSFDLSEDLPYIEADEGQLQQVIMNLVINASDAIGENPGVILVTTKTCRPAGDEVVTGFDRRSMNGDKFVSFEVRDTGCGMTPETKERIFDPFFTTKAHGRGLGLAAVLGIVRNHGGALKVDSVPGQSTTFRVLFPISQAQPSPSAPSDARQELRGNGTILVVDDDEAIRRMSKASLERFGYRVLLAEDGEQAVRIFGERRNEISLVLLDWAMPVMNGEEALRRILAIDPAAQVLMSSGYAESETLQRLGDRSLAGFLQKPYTTRHLAERIRDVLAEKQTVLRQQARMRV